MLTKQIPPALVDEAVADAGGLQRRCRLLPARAVMYFVLGLCLAAPTVDFLVPNMVGMNVQVAQNTMQANGVMYSISHDLLACIIRCWTATGRSAPRTLPLANRLLGDVEGQIDFGGGPALRSGARDRGSPKRGQEGSQGLPKARPSLPCREGWAAEARPQQGGIRYPPRASAHTMTRRPLR
ncbi:transposase domain-containing protein [Geodermatophilus africanus]|uniref:transposase domain-containing protein n=1 Tax=Geodermatophilus africanus TaxID=1137993 RepID=UPI000B840EDA